MQQDGSRPPGLEAGEEVPRDQHEAIDPRHAARELEGADHLIGPHRGAHGHAVPGHVVAHDQQHAHNAQPFNIALPAVVRREGLRLFAHISRCGRSACRDAALRER